MVQSADRAAARVTVAFASRAHARRALGFLATCIDRPLTVVLRSATVANLEADMILVDLELDVADEESVLTLLRGVHGLPVMADSGADLAVA